MNLKIICIRIVRKKHLKSYIHILKFHSLKNPDLKLRFKFYNIFCFKKKMPKKADDKIYQYTVYLGTNYSRAGKPLRRSERLRKKMRENLDQLLEINAIVNIFEELYKYPDCFSMMPRKDWRDYLNSPVFHSEICHEFFPGIVPYVLLKKISRKRFIK